MAGNEAGLFSGSRPTDAVIIVLKEFVELLVHYS